MNIEYVKTGSVKPMFIVTAEEPKGKVSPL